jgi:hypothetical protein
MTQDKEITSRNEASILEKQMAYDLLGASFLNTFSTVIYRVIINDVRFCTHLLVRKQYPYNKLTRLKKFLSSSLQCCAFNF